MLIEDCYARVCDSKTTRGTLISICSLGSVASANDLVIHSDEFNDAASLGNWSRVNVTEGWNADQLETLDVNITNPGQLVVMPFTCTWFQDYRGPMVYRNITGDVIVTTSISVTGRDGSSVPQSQFSLSGIMLRTPRNITPQTWSTGDENYIFFSIGHGNNGATSFQFEVKTTVNSVSSLQLSSAVDGNALLQIAGLGDYIIVLRKGTGESWIVHNRYTRTDMPETLQIGAVAYTNWEKASTFTPFDQNGNVLDPPLSITDPDPGEPFSPDIIGNYDYIRFFRPSLPSNLVGVDLTNTISVSDADLLTFLGASAVGGVDEPWVDFGFVGVETGSIDNPFNTLTEALFASIASTTIQVKGNTGTNDSVETLIINQPVTIDAPSGTVRIGDSGAQAFSGPRSTGFFTRP